MKGVALGVAERGRNARRRSLSPDQTLRESDGESDDLDVSGEDDGQDDESPGRRGLGIIPLKTNFGVKAEEGSKRGQGKRKGGTSLADELSRPNMVPLKF